MVLYKQVQGRFVFLNEKWKPMYKVGFIEPGNQDGNFFAMCLQVRSSLQAAQQTLTLNLQLKRNKIS